jgi:prepilin-type N-terminal cleavage/methylation domain-containing protein/prepilin-type processing-associated H-X9-DG protein
MKPSQTKPLWPIAGAFSLIELLIVVAIVAILVAMTMPALNRAKTRAQTAKCVENVRQLGAAFQLYSAENDGNLPYTHYIGEQYQGTEQLWWHREIAPYLGFTWDENSDWYATSKLPGVFRCPSDPFYASWWGAEESYGCNMWLTQAPSAGTPRTKRMAIARPSEMILLADTGHIPEDGGISLAVAPNDPSLALMARHNGSGTVGWLDGHVTLETAARLNALNEEPAPWPHWVRPL